MYVFECVYVQFAYYPIIYAPKKQINLCLGLGQAYGHDMTSSCKVTLLLFSLESRWSWLALAHLSLNFIKAYLH